MGRILKLLSISAKMDLRWLLRDTKYALVSIVSDVLSNLSMIAGVFLIAVRFDGIGGMSADEVLFMQAYATIITGVFVMFAWGNNGHISRIIGRGQLEHLLIQPLPLGTQLLTSGFAPFAGSSNFISGIVLMAVAVNRLGISLTWWFVLSLVANIVVTLVIIVAQSYLFSSAAFYAPVAAEEISMYVIDSTGYISTFPLSGMPLFMQIPLLTVIPSGLLAWFPSLTLLGKPPLGLTAFYPAIFAVLLTALAGIAFSRGLRYYLTKGANRYVPFGYRR